MKKIISLLLIIISLFAITSCEKKEDKKEALAFKEDYEKLNGKENKNGKVHRTISIDADNPFVEVNAENILDRINNKETFYVYFGSTLCPWCRSTIESAIKVAKDNKIDTIYYVDIWDDEGNEILRDKFEVENKKVKRVQNGTLAYSKLLVHFNDYLKDYEVSDSNGKTYKTGERRIFAPNFMYIKNGVIQKLTNGKADSQKDSREELTDEMRNEQLTKYRDFFKN